MSALGSRLVRFPLRFISNASVHTIEGLPPSGRQDLLNVPDSIDGLRPDAQGTAAIL